MNRAVLTALVLPFALAACTNNNDDAATTITVSAAASLTDAFTEIGAEFIQQNPGTDIRFNFAGSSTLAEQINSGAPVDVFAAASTTAMNRAADLLEEPELFAVNSLTIAVPRSNPASIETLSDLTNPSVTIIVCNAPVPCGEAAHALFEKNELRVTPASLERDVRAVLTKVVADEADAGIIYRTDVGAAGQQIDFIDIPDADNVRTTYPIATTTQAPELAGAFVDYVLSDTGQAVMRKWGFESP